jgi:hypothetical protein
MNSGLGSLLRFGLGWSQGIIGLVGAGSVLFEANRYFVRFYAREMAGLQFSGTNDCAGVEQVANGDLILDAETYCRSLTNYFPSLVLYQHHRVAAAAYYGVIVAAMLVVGLALLAAQRRIKSAAPFGEGAGARRAAHHEHLH